MRKGTILALAGLAVLSACKREPSFDERYAGAEKAIRAKAGELDKDMQKRASEAPVIDASDAVVPGAI